MKKNVQTDHQKANQPNGRGVFDRVAAAHHEALKRIARGSNSCSPSRIIETRGNETEAAELLAMPSRMRLVGTRLESNQQLRLYIDEEVLDQLMPYLDQIKK